ncbi:MAG: T9SS type A sorting domain-containing protein [Saprospiraceae bacterium]|nr:T9SS type A sorting domain-containing protein [Saprospiraceae bacterium]
MNISFIRRFSQLPFCLLLALLLGSTSASAQTTPNCFQLFFPTVQAQPGDTVCLPLMARDFEKIISLQFVVFWNPDDLEYVGKDISNSALAGILPNSFGLPMGNQIPVSWSSLTGLPISRPDSAILFNLCFRVKNGASGFLPLHIGGTWLTIFEVVQFNPPNTLLPLSQQIGGISTESIQSSDLTVSSTCVSNANCNQMVGSVSVEPSGGVPPYQYIWTGPNGFSATSADITGLAGGEYIVTVSDQTGSNVVVNVEVKSGLYTTTVVPQTISAFCGQSTGCATLEVGGNNPPFSFQWSAGNSQTAQNCSLPPGEHTVTVSDAIGCASVFSVEIMDDSILLLPAAWLVIEDCNGTQSATATPLNYPGPVEYLWSTGETTATVDGLVEGYYAVTVTTIAGGCSSIGEFLVLDGSTQSWQLALQAICDDPGNSQTGSLVLEMNPLASIEFPVMVSWSDGTTRLLGSPLDLGILDSLVGVTSGHYGVTVTDAAGCHTNLDKTMNCTAPQPVNEGYPWFYVQGDGTNPDSCAGVFAKNFEGISALTCSIAWSDYSSEFREIRNLQLPGLTQANFNVEPGEARMSLEWLSLSPITLPAESLLFEVCLVPKYPLVADQLRFTDEPSEPLLISQGESLAFVGRAGYLFFEEYQQEPPAVCTLAVLPPDCVADGKARILIEPCQPDSIMEGSFSHKNLLGEWHTFHDLSGLLFSDAGSYSIGAHQPSHDYDQFFAYIPATPAQLECAWPGDADNNNAVNHHDLLYLGLAFNAQGPVRLNASEEWIGQDAPDWVEATAIRNVNYKNIDSNGDGSINAADTIAIVQNWGRVINPAKDNPFDAPLDSFGNNPFPDISIDTDTLMPGQTANFPLLLGSQENQMDSIYGLAFSISYDASVVNENIRFTPSSSWFGDPSEYLCIQKNFPRQGRLDVAITRTNGIPVSGWGGIGNVFIIIEDNIFGAPGPFGPQDTTATTHFFFSEISSTSPGETPQIIAAPPVELIIRQQTVAAHEPFLSDREIALSPNPASENLLLQSKSARIHRVEISGADGSLHEVSEFGNPGQQVQIGLGKMTAGTYFARVFCGDGVAVKKFVVLR